MTGEYQLGKPLERCLSEARKRLRSENFALFAAAMEASRESGGRLNETVDRIAHSVRELQRLERKILSETAQARTSAFYMALAPAFVLAIYYFVLDPTNTERLFTTFAGQIMLCFAIVLTASFDHMLFAGPMNLPIISSACIVIISIKTYSDG